MTDLIVILDQLLAEVPGGVGRYSEELTRALIATAPAGSTVSAFSSAPPPQRKADIEREIPGLVDYEVSVLDRRGLALAWSRGIGRLHGLVHAPSPLAPLVAHDRTVAPADQVAVTFHDTVPWTHPETLTPHGVAWHKRMARRAERYADAVVVTSHTVAAELAELYSFGERIRIIPAAVSRSLTLPDDAEERAVRLALPENYVLAVGTVEPRKGLESLVRALGRPALDGTTLVHVGPDGWGGIDLLTVAREAGIDENRVVRLGRIDDHDLAVAMARAAVFVSPSLSEGFGLPLLEALAAGLPAVHSDAPALTELSAGAAIVVAMDPRDSYPDRLAEAVRGVLDDSALRERLIVQGQDRARAFRWADSAEKVWQLHADL